MIFLKHFFIFTTLVLGYLSNSAYSSVDCVDFLKSSSVEDFADEERLRELETVINSEAKEEVYEDALIRYHRIQKEECEQINGVGNCSGMRYNSNLDKKDIGLN